MKMEKIKNVYFKRGKNLMSGCDLPDVVCCHHFINCEFHPNCGDVAFTYCTFQECDGVRYLDSVADPDNHNQNLGSY